MASKKQIGELRGILRQLSEGIEFVMHDDVSLMRRRDMCSTDVFESQFYPGERYHKLCKDIGSKFCCVLNAQNSLRRLIERLEQPKIARQ